jgi:PTS system nitrogen regulatory IIA component
MTLSINDLTCYFGVGADTVERWVRQGRIPAFRQDGSLRFRKKDIDKWAAQQNIRLRRLDTPGDEPEEPVPSLLQAMENGGVCPDIKGKDKDAVISACIEKMDFIPQDFKQDLVERIGEREEAMSTGIGNGIAIPHPREPVSYLPRSAIVTCFLASPIEFKAMDTKPVHTIFFLLSTSLTHHLPLLSSLSRCLKDQRFLNCLESRPDLNTLIQEIQPLGV